MAKVSINVFEGGGLMVGKRTLQAFLGFAAIGWVCLTGPLHAQNALAAPTLGLYDSAGYPYYPIETHVFGARQFANEVQVARVTPTESRPSRSAARARLAGPLVQANRAPVAVGFGTFPQVTRRRPKPLADSMIMDPWAVGVFR